MTSVSTFITEIRLKNFKGFTNKSFEKLSPSRNILIGDNDSGKSSVLLALDLVLSGNSKRIDALGLDRLMNQNVVDSFMQKHTRKFDDLPELQVDVIFNDHPKHEFLGEHNLSKEEKCGVYLLCAPREDLEKEINELLEKPEAAFPFEYYSAVIRTCGGQTITSYNRPLQHVTIDNSKISNDYASKSYIRSMFEANTSMDDRNRFKHLYRTKKEEFSSKEFSDLNNNLDVDLKFKLKNNSQANIETDLTITQRGVDIENLGVGSQCFVRTHFALSKKSSLDVVLLEEPENHLSHSRMRQLIGEIESTQDAQVFITTHNSLITSRLGLDSAILMGGLEEAPVMLANLSDDTSVFFKKAPSHSLLEFVLSERNILVEGDAEYMLIADFFEQEAGRTLEEAGVNVISIGGISFPRYLEVAQLLKIKTAVVTDNDSDIENKCERRYAQFQETKNIEVFYDKSEARSTFEICIYQDNEALCDKLFSVGRRTLSPQEYMLKNKSEASFLLTTQDENIRTPDYIVEAIKWVIS